MSIQQIAEFVHIAAAERREVIVTMLVGERFTGVCTFAGNREFRVDSSYAAMVFAYDEIEAVE